MRRPRTVLATTLALLVAITALLVTSIVRGHAGERQQAERRFEERSSTTAALTASLFAVSARQNRGPNAKRLGKPTMTRADLDRAFAGGGYVYSALFDARGRLLTTGSGTTSATTEYLEAVPPRVRRVLDGKEPFNWSDPLTSSKGAVVEVVSRYETDSGPRVTVRGVPLRSLAPFIGDYLHGLPGARQARAYVVDASAGVIASAAPAQPAPGRLADHALIGALAGTPRSRAYGEDRHLATAPVARTPWRVVITEPDAVLYAGVGGTQPWVLLAVMLLAGLAAVTLTWRVALAKAHLRRAYDVLETQSAELERSNVELKRSNAELEQFASVASHDLQEPLRKVQTFGDQLERRFGDDIPAEGKDYLRRMRNASARMSTLIDDLLRFSRVTTHARPPRSVDLAKVAREVVIDLETRISTTHGTVDVRTMPSLEADPTQMRQLLQNLIGNALKFHRPGVEPVVTLEALETGDPEQVGFAVSDNGIGFEPVYADRIFRVFERLHARDVYEGTGIGLALCRKIVERHGGSIVAAGEPDGGARFVVMMPRAQADAAARVQEPAAPVTETKEPVGV